jgi:putative ATPase
MNTPLLDNQPAEDNYQPLASRMRPTRLCDFIGQSHLMEPGKALQQAIVKNSPHSMILWGPPGVGKTTLARIIATECECHFESLSAVLDGVKDIRQTIERARYHQSISAKPTILFVDEVHRFNKSQQDAFLPHIENGTVIFIGATTENPAFELNNALLSRARVYLLHALSEQEILKLMEIALSDSQLGLGATGLKLSSAQKKVLARASDGDARRVLNYLEIMSDLTVADGEGESGSTIPDSSIAQVLEESSRRFDKRGDIFYDQISALHKSVRGSSPDAALYWLSRMLDGGCDPVYIARRLVRMASEDIGNADPRALELSLNGWDTYTRLGSPEGELALAQVVAYLACAPKSNAVYKAFGSAQQLVASSGSEEVPLHLRNASTTLAEELGHGEDYRYAHDEDSGFAAGENYFPEALKQSRFYYPVQSGLEIRIKEKMDNFRKLDTESHQQRYEKSKKA